MNKDKRNNIQLLGTLNNADESGIIANANQVYDANEDKSTQDVSKEHKERIETLEAKESSMQTTLENITKIGEASAASNVTYNHNDSKLDATNVQQAVDEVYKRSNYNDGDNIIDFNTIHLITDNPEFAIAVVDANDRILYGIKADGQPYWGVGVPRVVRNYVDKQVNDILGTDNITETIDSLKEVEKFLSDFKNSDTLKALLDTKANKTDVDNVIANINANIADKYKKSNPNDSEGNVVDTNTIVSIENNPEYIKVITDNVGKLIEAIGIDGIRKFFAGIEVQGTLQCVTDNPEYLVAWVDNENRIIFAIQHDGNPYFGYGVPKQIKTVIDNLNTDLVNKYTEVKQSISDTNKHLSETSADIDKKINLGNNVYPSGVHEVSEFEDNISVLLDNLNHILESLGSDGVRKFFAGIEVAGNKFTTTNNPEYKAVLLDKDNKILIGIRNDGDVYFATGVPKQIQDEIKQIKDKVNLGLDTYPKDVNTVVDNAEYAKALVDADNKVLEGIEPDGTHKFNNKANLKGTEVDTVNYENCTQLLCDKDNKIIDSIDDKGVITHNSKHIFKGGIEDATGKIIEEAYNHVIKVVRDYVDKQVNESVNKNSTLIEEIAHANHLEFTPDDTFHAYINGLYFAQDLQSTICDLAKDGDKMVHVSTFTIINDIIYATYYCNTIDGYEDPSKHTARFVIAPLSTISDKTTYQYIDLCYTQTVALNDNKEEILIDNKHITALYDIVLLRKDDNILFLEWTVALNGVYYRVYKTYNIETNEYSDVSVNTFTVNGETLSFNTINLKGLLDKNNIAYRPMFSDIGIMQKLSSREENGETYYYTGCYCGDFGAIIKSKDLINWIFVSSPSFMNESQWENAVYVKNNRVYYCCRQDQNIETNKIFLAYYDINRNTWSRPVYIFDAQSRYDMLEVDNKLFVVHSPRDRSHLAITQIDTYKIAYSKMIQVAQVPDYFYPFMQKYNNELYMSFTQSRKHIYISKFKIRYKSDSDINNKMLQFLNS